jgi:hypothetical protein
MDDLGTRTSSIKATLLKGSDRCRVHINGKHWQGVGETRYLRNGDYLSLDNLRYEYKLFSVNMNHNSSSQQQQPTAVELLSSSTSSQASLSSTASLDEKEAADTSPKCSPLDLDDLPCSPPPSDVVPATSSLPAISLSEDIATRLSEDIQCSICLEIQIHSQTLVPCGHSLCYPCVVNDDLQDCPTCRAQITALVPSRQLDGLISNLVAVPGLLDKEDVQQYHERKKQHYPTVRFCFVCVPQLGRDSLVKNHLVSHNGIVCYSFYFLVLESLAKCLNELPNDNVIIELQHNIHGSIMMTIFWNLRQLNNFHPLPQPCPRRRRRIIIISDTPPRTRW